jgi:hypothetical protein
MHMIWRLFAPLPGCFLFWDSKDCAVWTTVQTIHSSKAWAWRDKEWTQWHCWSSIWPAKTPKTSTTLRLGHQLTVQLKQEHRSPEGSFSHWTWPIWDEKRWFRVVRRDRKSREHRLSEIFLKPNVLLCRTISVTYVLRFVRLLKLIAILIARL